MPEAMSQGHARARVQFVQPVLFHLCLCIQLLETIEVRWSIHFNHDAIRIVNGIRQAKLNRLFSTVCTGSRSLWNWSDQIVISLENANSLTLDDLIGKLTSLT